MTDANHPHRLALVTAYAQAYRQASGHGLAAAVSPARIAGQSFPRPACGAGKHARRPRRARQSGTRQAGHPPPARPRAMTHATTSSSRKET